MSRLPAISIVLGSLILAACSGGGGGGGAAPKTVTGTASSFAEAIKTITTSYSDGTSTSQILTGNLSSSTYSSDGSQKTPVYSFPDGTTHSGTTLTGTPSAAYDSSLQPVLYTPAGLGCTDSACNKYTSYAFPDGTTRIVLKAAGNLDKVTYGVDALGTPCTATACNKYVSYRFSDGSTYQIVAVGSPTAMTYYSNSDGAPCTATTCNAYIPFVFGKLGFSGAILNVFNSAGTPGTVSYAANSNGDPCTATSCNEYIPFSYAGSLFLTYKAELPPTASTANWANDHVTKTISYRFANGGSASVPVVIEPSISSAPTLTQAVYPSDWAMGGSVVAVQKPSVSMATGIYGDGVAYTADGSASAPFRQATLTPNGPAAKGAITDPNAFITAPTTGTYNLTWGTPDPAGPAYAKNFNQGTQAYQLPKSMKIFDATLSNGTVAGCFTAAADVAGCGAILSAPQPDVIAAWNNGWTGNGINVMIYDNIGASTISEHPATVEIIASRYAWGATFFGFSYNQSTPSVLNLDGTVASTSTPKAMGVINMSFGADLAKQIGRANNNGNPWTTNELLNQRSAYQTTYNSRANTLNDASYSGAFNFSDAVLTKAAGNDAIDAQYEPLVYWLSRNSSDVTRLLVVGALTQIGSTTSKAVLANYSNKAGSDLTVQSRFLVAAGTVAFKSLDNYYNGKVLSGSSLDGNSDNVGTSYAAPRVAGYAAIVRQKFPNLTGANTANILLATARTDTLTCYPNCDKSVYGQGEASLSRALAPVGYLQ